MPTRTNNDRSESAWMRLSVAALIGMTLVAYSNVHTHNFINLDDPQYVYENPMVQNGLTFSSIRWAFTSFAAANWHPLTWLSHMLDIELFGLQPGGHHVTSLFLHLANVGLLYWVLVGMFRGQKGHWGEDAVEDNSSAPSRSSAMLSAFFVTGVFALHPLHVESVAWVSERKDVLCGFFWVLTLLAYTRYAREAGGRRFGDSMIREEFGAGRDNVEPPKLRMFESWYQSLLWYGLTLLCFVCALMSKPMAVTLPFVLLLLDWWPLRRCSGKASTHLVTQVPLGRRGQRPKCAESVRTSASKDGFVVSRLLIEKVPFVVLASLSVWITVAAQHSGGAVRTLMEMPLDVRLQNAATSIVVYLRQFLWPQGLAVFYPYSVSRPGLQVAAAVIGIAGLAALAWKLRRRCPGMLVGWLWFLVTLTPVLGIVQVGNQAMADRYTYIPGIGLSLAIVSLALDRFKKPASRHRLAQGMVGFMLAWTILTFVQCRYWADNESLYRHALRVTRGNWLAHNNLGNVLAQEGRVTEALSHLAEAVRLAPENGKLAYNLATELRRAGRIAEADAAYSRAWQVSPEDPTILTNYGAFLYQQGRFGEAIALLERAVAQEPDLVSARSNLGIVLAHVGRTEEGLRNLEVAAGLAPDNGEVFFNLANELARVGRSAEAEAAYKHALRASPGHPKVLTNFGAFLYEQGRTQEAISVLQRAVVLGPEVAVAHINLGHALTQAGRYAEALERYREARRQQPGNLELRSRLAATLAELGQYHEAELEYREVLRAAPDSLDVYKKLGGVLQFLGREDEAQDLFRHARAIQP